MFYVNLFVVKLTKFAANYAMQLHMLDLKKLIRCIIVKSRFTDPIACNIAYI